MQLFLRRGIIQAFYFHITFRSEKGLPLGEGSPFSVSTFLNVREEQKSTAVNGAEKKLVRLCLLVEEKLASVFVAVLDESSKALDQFPFFVFSAKLPLFT